MCILQKSRPSSNVKLRSKVKVTGDKKRKSAAFFGSGPQERGYTGGKIRACSLVASIRSSHTVERPCDIADVSEKHRQKPENAR